MSLALVPMKRILVWGAGHSSGALIDYLGDRCKDSGWSVTVGDLSKSHVEEKTKDHPGLEAIELSLDDVERADPLIREADLVISLLPQSLHPRVAERCLAQGTNLLTASYVSDEMAALSDAAKAKGLLFLNECGLDPGIDHLSGMRVIDRIREEGGELTSFETFTGGLLAPNPDPNPWDYKFTWNPRNVVLAAQGRGEVSPGGALQVHPVPPGLPSHRGHPHSWLRLLRGLRQPRLSEVPRRLRIGGDPHALPRDAAAGRLLQGLGYLSCSWARPTTATRWRASRT